MLNVHRSRVCAWCCLLLSMVGIGCGNSGRASSGPARDPVRAEVLTNRSLSMMSTDVRRAELLLRDAIEADGFHGPAHNNLGVILLQREAMYEAASAFEQARRLMPGVPEPRLNLGLVMERAGRIDRAADLYGIALEVAPEHLPAIQALARVQLRYGREDRRTRELLQRIALRGAAPWRDWARLQLVRIGGSAPGDPGTRISEP